MKITAQILSIPPYLSTSWKNISSLHALPEKDRFKLVIVLHNRMRVTIPDLDKVTIDEIFEGHARYCSSPEQSVNSNVALPFAISGGGVDLLNSATQHNPAQSDLPPLPKELLDKVAGIAKVLGFDESAQIPKPEPHCNCPFCQVARAFHEEPAIPCSAENDIEEIVTDKDLAFRNWTIEQSSASKDLYIVSNPLDENEHYSVYLGKPLGCTCGQKNCEHIRAVLNS